LRSTSAFPRIARLDREWQAHGNLDQAVELAARWARERPVEDLRVEIVRLPGRTPILLVEVPEHADETVLLYGHLDRQPAMVGWSEGPVAVDASAPRRPAVRPGRGGRRVRGVRRAHAVESLQAHGVPHAGCVIGGGATVEAP
jgi:hypothetical protein